MCGIVYGNYKDGRRANKSVIKRYYKQSTRGKEGYGYVTIDKNKIKDVVRATGEKEIKDKLMEDKSSMILFHHRRPTSTPNIPECAHPILVSNDSLNYDYLVVHNGVISNAKNLRTTFEAEGFVFNTVVEKLFKSKYSGVEYYNDEQFNDSESFAIDLVKNIETGGDDIKSIGSIAFVAVQYDKETGDVQGIFYGRNNSNPLKLDKTKDCFVLASEGNGTDVPVNKLFCYDPISETISSETLILGAVPPPSVTPKPTESKVLPPNYHYENSNKAVDKPPFGFGIHKNPMDIVRESSHEQVIRDNNFATYKKIKDVGGIPNEYKTIELTLSDNTKKTVFFRVTEKYLFKTKIDVFQLHMLTNVEWLAYENMINEINQFIMMRNTMSRDDKKDKYLKDIDDVNKELKKLHMQLNEFSEDINKRIDEKF